MHRSQSSRRAKYAICPRGAYVTLAWSIQIDMDRRIFAEEFWGSRNQVGRDFEVFRGLGVRGNKGEDPGRSDRGSLRFVDFMRFY